MLITMANVQGVTLLTLITGAVGLVPVYKSTPAPIGSTQDRMWSRINTKICSQFWKSKTRTIKNIWESKKWELLHKP